jgi:predicted MFS family arabinose efflux permease
LAIDRAPAGKSGEVTGQYFTAYGLAMFLGPLFCSILVNFMSYRNMLLVVLALSLLSIAVFFKAGLHKKNRISNDQSGEVEFSILDSFKRTLKSKNVKSLLLTRILWSIPLAIFGTLFSIYAQENLFLSSSLIGMLFTVRGGMNALIRIPAGKIMDKIGGKKPLILSFFLHFLTLIIISIANNYPLLILAMVIFGFGWGIQVVNSNAILSSSVNPDDRSLVLSISLTMSGIGQLLGSTIAGLITPLFSMHDIFRFSAFLYLPSILIIILFIREEKL